MLDLLYDKALQNKMVFSEFMENATESLDFNKIESFYTEYQIPYRTQDKSFAAVDGSFNKKKFIGFFVKAICSQAIVSIPNEPLDKCCQGYDLSPLLIPKGSNIDTVLSSDMGIYELKSTILALEKFDLDYVFIDGSIRGDLINSFSGHANKLSSNDIEILKSYSREMLDHIVSDGVTILSDTYKYKSRIDKDMFDVKEDAYSFLKTLEYLVCLFKLLSENRKKVVSISKTSNSNDILEYDLPDIALFEYYFKEEGYSKEHRSKAVPFYKRDDRAIKTNFYIEDAFFKRLTFTHLFVKFEYNKNFLKIEVPYDATDLMIHDLLEDIKSTCIEGYPYILKKAHNEVVITNRDMASLIKILDIHDKTGRDML
ncbi:MAG: DNA double-strand break repair nuclease NurA [Methanobacteriaceae archaeon]|nr:DNA double-strand break repair nuclease NurA [Methanobacteriaceae archaeon]